MKVLVAIDDRPSSQATIDAIVKMHWSEGTEITVVTVLPPVEDGGSDGEPSAIVEEMENVAVELRNSLRQCEVLFFARQGDAKSVILELAEQIRADLIVVGSNCKSTLERLLLGSVCQSILNAAQCPVIVAKTPCCLAREASPGFRNILVPIDNSVFSDVAVQWLSNFQWAANTRFIVAAVADEDSDIKQVKRSLEKRARDLSKFLNTNNIMVEIAIGVPQHVIADLAKQYYADLIVMGSHGNSGLKDLILGSVAHAVSHVAPCAVAIVRVAGNEIGAHRNAAYEKATAVATSSFAGSLRREQGNSDASAHIIPAGF